MEIGDEVIFARGIKTACGHAIQWPDDRFVVGGNGRPYPGCLIDVDLGSSFKILSIWDDPEQFRGSRVTDMNLAMVMEDLLPIALVELAGDESKAIIPLACLDGVQAPSGPATCQCPIQVIMATGCRCGGV